MKTALYDRHCALGAKMVLFAGWEMPVQYKGIIHEHQVVRQAVGLFDVSHMGRIKISGSDAETFLDFLSTNHISDKEDNSATYTVWCHPQGGSVDDLIVYREDLENFFVIVNASNRQKDLEHLQRYAENFDVKIDPCFDREGILALQGPKSGNVLIPIFPEVENLKHMHFIEVNYHGLPVIISNTGYTGSGGYEIYAPTSAIVELWDLFLEQGKPFGIEPVGLGARDTLRLEMGYALYGHELSDDIFPAESVSAWTVKRHKVEFLGREALEDLERSPKKRHEYGVVLMDPGIAREGYEVFQSDQAIGKVTSGTLSPSLNKAIAIIIVDKVLAIGDIVEIKIRQNKSRAQVVKLPFWHEGL